MKMVGKKRKLEETFAIDATDISVTQRETEDPEASSPISIKKEKKEKKKKKKKEKQETESEQAMDVDDASEVNRLTCVMQIFTEKYLYTYYIVI